MADLLALADEKRMSKRFEKVSLGQGQGPKAERLLELGMEQGLWVCLQNCHLAVSWMPSLERIVQNIQPDKVCATLSLLRYSAGGVSGCSAGANERPSCREHFCATLSCIGGLGD